MVEQEGVRFVMPSLAGLIGDDFLIGVRVESIPQIVAGLNKVKELQPGPTMADEATRIIYDLQDAPPNGWNRVGDVARNLRIHRIVDHVTHKLPKVMDCDRTRILTWMMAIVLSATEEMPLHFQMIRESGIPLKMRTEGDGIRISLFGDSVLAAMPAKEIQ